MKVERERDSEGGNRKIGGEMKVQNKERKRDSQNKKCKERSLT